MMDGTISDCIPFPLKILCFTMTFLILQEDAPYTCSRVFIRALLIVLCILIIIVVAVCSIIVMNWKIILVFLFYYFHLNFSLHIWLIIILFVFNRISIVLSIIWCAFNCFTFSVDIQHKHILFFIKTGFFYRSLSDF